MSMTTVIALMVVVALFLLWLSFDRPIRKAWRRLLRKGRKS